jgi:outer membrane protein TolC
MALLAVLILAGGISLGAQTGAGGPGGAVPDTENAEGAEKRRLDVKEAVDLALKNNLALQAGAIALDTKKRKSDLVWNQFLPDLAVRGTLARQNEENNPASATIPVPNSGTPFQLDGVSGRVNPNFFVTDPITVPQWHVQGNFSASLTLSLALFSGIQAIKADYQTGLLTYEKARVQTERDVRKAYNSMLLLIENIALLRESYAAAERQVAVAEANYRAGLAPELTLLQARVARDNLKPNIDQAENGFKLAQANFAMTLGLPYETPFDLVPVAEETNFIPLDLADLIHKAARNRPDIRELQQQLATLERSRRAQAMQARTPYLNFSWNLNPTFSPALDPFKDTWFEKDNWSDGGTFSITLGIGLNGLFPFTKEGQALKDVDNQIKTVANGISQMIRGTELEIYNTLLSLEQVQSTVEAQIQTVNMAEQSYRLTEEAYRAGLQDLLQVQNAELELRRARLAVVQQQFNYLNSLVDLEYAVGAPFGSLSAAEQRGDTGAGGGGN